MEPDQPVKLQASFYHRYVLLSSDWLAAFKTHAPIRINAQNKGWLIQEEILRNLKLVLNKLIVKHTYVTQPNQFDL